MKKNETNTKKKTKKKKTKQKNKKKNNNNNKKTIQSSKQTSYFLKKIYTRECFFFLTFWSDEMKMVISVVIRIKTYLRWRILSQCCHPCPAWLLPILGHTHPVYTISRTVSSLSVAHIRKRMSDNRMTFASLWLCVGPMFTLIRDLICSRRKLFEWSSETNKVAVSCEGRAYSHLVVATVNPADPIISQGRGDVWWWSSQENILSLK